ncbi:MAG TPA: 4-(cytidine 5'-diphospho)-2-C-methyl-D-erythritol kinase [Bryobacteraceae bacterium]|nr:4-(cytidine 5'-diphospho)-2-C-methyl-D-erythritol kinase [Bryobacteraceae bacterium]
MTIRVRVRSLAKINLDLRVLNKRPDGYHELRTIFQTVSLADTIDIDYSPHRTRIDLSSNLNIHDDLVVRAADNVLAATGKAAQIGFVLRKRIPLGAGLGGGSSNAAAVLMVLPRLLGRPLPMGKLMELAAALGSDVPFFLLGGTAAGLGRGTELYPLPDLPSLPALLVTPGIHVSTPGAYTALNRGSAADATPDVTEFQSLAWRLSSAPSSDWDCVNDFETVVFRQHPQLKSIKGKLQKLGARPALMSGSGSTVFGIFPSRELRDRAARMFRREFAGDQVHSVQLVSRSRYSGLWRRQLESVRG